MRNLRPRSADEDIQLQFRLELTARADASIDVRSKSAVSARVPWSPRFKLLPFPGVSERVLPASTQAPTLAPSKSWPEFKAKVVPCLQRFYSRAYRHPVHIPPEEGEEMLQFLKNGPAPPSAPAWIDWSRDIPQSEADAAAVDAPASGPDERAPTSGPAEIRRKKEYHPFLAPRKNADGKKCRCEFATECAAASCMSDNYYTHTHVHTCTRTRAHARAHTCTHTHVHACDKVWQHDPPQSNASRLSPQS